MKGGIFEVLKRSVAGTISGICAFTIGHPLDTLRIRLQVDEGTKALPNTLDTCKCLKLNEGICALYKGYSSVFCCFFPVMCMVYTGNSLTHYALTHSKFTPLQRQFTAGCMGGVCGCLVKAPMELLKNRAQIYRTQFLSFPSVIRSVVLHDGIRGLYRGLFPTIVRDVPRFGVYFSTFYKLRTTFIKEREAMVLRLSKLFMCGALAGIVGIIFVYPLDIAKNIIQCDTRVGKERPGITQVWREKMQLLGIRFIRRGFAATLMRQVPVSGVNLLVFDRLLEFMNCNFKQLYSM